MKKSLILAAFAAAGLVFAEEPLLKNGGFETTQKTPKGVHKYIQDQVKNGWDLGLGPIASYPKEWLPNGGKDSVKKRIVLKFFGRFVSLSIPPQ